MLLAAEGDAAGALILTDAIARLLGGALADPDANRTADPGKVINLAAARQERGGR